jgi:hypothetical protein
LGFDSKLLSRVSGVVLDSILSFYERRMRDVLGPLARVTLSQPSQERANDVAHDAGEAEATVATQHPKTRRLSEVQCVFRNDLNTDSDAT